MADEFPIANPTETDHSEVPTERATLQIRTNPLSITVSSQGTAAKILALGVIGPAATIMVGHFVGVPAWVIAVISLLQIAAAVMRRGN